MIFGMTYWMFVFSLCMIGLGIWIVIMPDTAWHISRGRKFAKRTPSKTAIAMTRLCGVICAAAGITFFFT